MPGEPTTPNTALIVPNTGDLVGTWGSNALNVDFVAIDGMLGGTTTLALGAAALTVLSVPPSGTIAATAGPNQSQNACINITGTITGNNVVQLTMPGRYIFHNQMYNNPYAFYVQLQSAGGGRKIGLPPGKKCTVYHDGINVDYVDMPDPGTAYDFHHPTIPAWMSACTIAPYLLKDGTIYTFSQYPALANLLGNTFGGDGVSTFAVPDELARMRVPFDPLSTGRMTAPINAGVMGSVGGEQSHTLVVGEMPAHGHPVIDPTHSHPQNASTLYSIGGVTVTAGASLPFNISAQSTGAAATNITIGNSGGGSSHNNIQPGIVSFLALIKTAIVFWLVTAALNMLPGNAFANQINSTVAASKISSSVKT